ncbi:muscle M-line assembly protein unc-89 isoform X4 [Anopheles gambiae]|uniref:muscle M-line assembly protein unc-89 isoform X3 n=1 Tax=Anopheles coluzzii TaxID=1518534 RepID=UPI0020FF7E9E|nr:muscle M-line assembly protein unc-89 isoform X3 [Anopheles coluzzii]XP_061499451.1 muscle M-line assembly protein unc-89 isoform X4 [Anopheles gambiae]XP_061499452.1 muscle M-line assembly protein unc-89 isoform X4 [Anopheles gambiae]
MSEQMEQVGLPPGWDCKYDSRTGRYYYVNLFTKTTQWEDPRARIRQLQTGAPLHISNDSISMQPVHGSPYHVYPASNSFYPAQAAFQNPPSGVPSLNASPNLAQRLQQQQQQQHIEMSPMVRSSPRMGLGRQGMVETTFTTNVTAAETDLTVAKINSMFPTVPETHIRMLLKKYMKSIFPKAEETLILDVLANADNNVQTASQQLLKMGYDKREQPVPQRSSASRKGTGTSQATEDDKKEELKTPTPKLKSPEEKKKIKARLQTKYKDTPEKIILMALESVDYSEERAKKILNIVIQEDRDKKKSVKIETPHKAEEDKENARASAGPSRSNSTASSQPRTPLLAKRAHDGSGVAVAPSQDPGKTTVDGTVKATEQQQEGAAAEASTTIAASLEADHSPGASTTESSSSDTTPDDSSSPDSSPATKLRDGDGVRSVGKQNRPKAKTDHAKYSIFRTSSSEDESSEQQQMGTDGKLDGKSPQLASRIPTKGPNMKLFKGPNDDLLLTDYVTWNGANPDLAKGSQKKSTGPDRAIRTERTYKPHGPNAELCKGPVGSLAKGSMYTQLMKDVKCN